MAEPLLARGRFSLVSLRPLPDALINHVSGYLADEAAEVTESTPHSPDLFTRSWLFTHEDVASLELELRTPAMALGIDSALTSGELAVTGPRLVVSDVDSTFFQDEVIELVARRAGTEDEVKDITTRAMEGNMDFKESLRLRVATIAGQPESVLDDVRAEVRLTDGALALVDTVHRYGAKMALVSGGFIEVVGPIAESSAIDFVLANTFEKNDGVLTGRTSGPVVDGAAKLDAVETWAAELEVPLDSVVVVGDGANDLPMMGIAGLGIAFQGKQIVVEQADCAISFPRLDAVAALLGWDVN